MQGKTNLIAAIAGIGVGTGLMYFLDPNRGKQRRAAARCQAKLRSRQFSQAVKTVDRRTHDLVRTADDFTKLLFSWKRKALKLVA
jgi:hypothetical protein